MNFENFTKIQQLALPILLDNKDLIAQAKTGSGKTVAFCLPIVEQIQKAKTNTPMALILSPTRELSTQIALELRKLLRFIPNVKVLTLCGGVPYNPQVNSLRHGANIVIATAGRLLKHLKQGNIDISNVTYFVLDEADKMLDMGFYEDIQDIISYLPNKRQTTLFSATYEKNIEDFAKNITNDALFVKVQEEKNRIIEKVYFVEDEQKTALIPALISSNKVNSVLIFCATKLKCEELADELYNLGLDVLTLHSDLEQRQRDETIILFSNKSYPILIATDVASRGIHIDDIQMVINYDMAKDEDIHTHRIGRTARAGSDGLAISLCTKEEEYKISAIKDRNNEISIEDSQKIIDDFSFEIDSEFRTIFINAGKKQKIRAGDILGVLTAGIGLKKEDIGKIDILDFCSYVAVKKELKKFVLNELNDKKIKGKYYKVYEK